MLRQELVMYHESHSESGLITLWLCLLHWQGQPRRLTRTHLINSEYYIYRLFFNTKLSSTILPRPSNPSLEPTFIHNTAGQKVDSTRYSDYHSLVQHTTYLRVLEDFAIVEDITPGYSSARQTRNGCRVLYGLKKGDVVKILERWWEDYWLGKSHGRRGFFLLDHRFVSRLFSLPFVNFRSIYDASLL